MTNHNPHLLQRLKAIQDTMMAQHSGAKGLPSAQAGTERETFLREFLQRVFPAHRRFTSGSITDSDGAISGQVDVAIEYGFVPSFPLPSTDDRLLLAESVALVIEVKSNLSSQWREVQQTVKSVRTLRRKLRPVMTFGQGAANERIPTIAVGYKGYRTMKGIERRLKSTDPDSRPDAALVIESGAFVGFGVQADGPLGLYALCLGINSVLNSLGFAAPDLLAYVDREPDA